MVNESKTMYLPEDTLENHQGKITFCFCVLRVCVCVCLNMYGILLFKDRAWKGW